MSESGLAERAFPNSCGLSPGCVGSAAKRLTPMTLHDGVANLTRLRRKAGVGAKSPGAHATVPRSIAPPS